MTEIKVPKKFITKNNAGQALKKPGFFWAINKFLKPLQIWVQIKPYCLLFLSVELTDSTCLAKLALIKPGPK